MGMLDKGGDGMSAMTKAKFVGISVIVSVVIIVIFQNLPAVQVQVLFWSFTLSQALLVMVVIAAGFVAGLLTASLMGARTGKGRS